MSKPPKDIKRLVKKQLKKTHPNWNRLRKKNKKAVIKNIAIDIYKNYDFNNQEVIPKHELFGIDPIPKNIITVKRMREIIKQKQTNIFPLNYFAKRYIKDQELLAITEIVDWNLLNYLLADRSYTAGKRTIKPVQYFRAELLKSLKYPEISYRKFAEKEINNKERKENRAFIGIKKEQQISHNQLSQFRSSLDFSRLVNVMVYFICLFLDKKEISNSTFYAVDSTELAAKTSVERELIP